MTLDEIIECIKEVKEDYWEDDGYGYVTADCQRMITALDEVMERLEQTRWIPVSERLPEESIKQIMLGDEHTSDFVLVTIKGQTYPFPKAKVRVARYSYTHKAWQIANNNFGKVVAWMPLPDPYKASPTCADCILDNTDACTRGAGRAVDDEACEDYLASPTGAEGSDKE